ncbi:MAG: hypothetical protein LBB72_02275 [Spirochaetaceae bacterium]|jgi:hypothetical protein|nr:hypothetical protein [Spirochaetaceae bacterium]
MKRYCIKSQPGIAEYLDILEEIEDGYKIRITRMVDGDEKIREDFIERQLFETCLSTGYIAELDGVELNSAAA